MRLDKVAQHTEVLRNVNRNSRSGRHRRKEYTLTGGGLQFHGVGQEKSADSIVVVDTSQVNDNDKQGGLTKL